MSKDKKPRKKNLKKKLKKLSQENKPVTLIIKSGENCCELTGCIVKVNKDLVTLITNKDTCRNIIVVIDCICAIIKPPIDEKPPIPPDEECECQVTAGGITGTPPQDNASLQLVACPGCTLEPGLVSYENNEEDTVELTVMPAGPGEITSVSCEDDQAATIEGTGQVTIDGEGQGLCEFILDVIDTPPPDEDTIRMQIFCNGEVHDSGVLELLGQSVNIQEC